MPIENLPDVKETKRLLNKLTPDAPLPFAFAPGEKAVPSILLLHLTRAGKAQFELIKKETGLKDGTYGSARIADGVLMLDCEKKLAGAARAVKAYLKANKPMPVDKVRLFVDGVEVLEKDDAPPVNGTGASSSQPVLPPLPSTPPPRPSTGVPAEYPAAKFLAAIEKHKTLREQYVKTAPSRVPALTERLKALLVAVKARDLAASEQALTELVNLVDDTLAVTSPTATGGISALEFEALHKRAREVLEAQRRAAPHMTPEEKMRLDAKAGELVALLKSGGAPDKMSATSHQKALGLADHLAQACEAIAARPRDQQDDLQAAQVFQNAHAALLLRQNALGAYLSAGVRERGAKAMPLARGGNFPAAMKALGEWEREIKRLEQTAARQAAEAQRLRAVAPAVESLRWSDNELKNLDKATDKGALKGHGSEFKAVLKALGTLNRDGSPANADALEAAARAYMAEADRQYERLSAGKKQAKDQDRKSDLKYKTCEDMIRLADRYRAAALGAEAAAQPPPPWSRQQEETAVALEARILALANGARQLSSDDGAGQSASFFIKDARGGNAFLAKPAAGEHVPNANWKSGGGAAREAMLSAVNDNLRDQTGLDFGVAPTSLTVLKGGGMDGLASVQRTVPVNKKFAEFAGERLAGGTLPVADLQKILVLDLVTLNLDRQPDNILVNEPANGGPATCTPIDAGFALPSRRAFAQFKTALSSSALFANASMGNERLDPAVVEALDRLDPDQHARHMREANARLEKVDPAARGLIGDESIEMSRRSALFLKALAREFTTSEIAYAYGRCFDPVLDAAPGDVERAIKAALAELRRHVAAKRELDALTTNPHHDLGKLGWKPLPPAIASDHTRMLDILRNGTRNPVRVRELAAILRQVGGAGQVTVPPNERFEDADINNQILYANQELARRRMRDPAIRSAMTGAGADAGMMDSVNFAVDMSSLWASVSAKGGAPALARLNQTMPGTTFEQKAFELAGGEAQLKKCAEVFVTPKLPKTLPANEPARTRALRAYYKSAWQAVELYNEFEALGGMDTLLGLEIITGSEASPETIVGQMRQLLQG